MLVQSSVYYGVEYSHQLQLQLEDKLSKLASNLSYIRDHQWEPRQQRHQAGPNLRVLENI